MGDHADDVVNSMMFGDWSSNLAYRHADSAMLGGAGKRRAASLRIASNYAEAVQAAGVKARQHDFFTPSPARSGLTKKGTTMKTRNELLNLGLSVSDDIVCVRCVFSKTRPKSVNHLTEYSYKCPRSVAETLSCGDLVLVEVASGDKPMAVAYVQTVDADFSDVDLSIKYAWVISKIDCAVLERLQEYDIALTDKLYQAQKRHMQRTTLSALMGVDGELDIPRLDAATLAPPTHDTYVDKYDVIEEVGAMYAPDDL